MVRVLSVLYHLPEGRRLNRWWAGWDQSFKIFVAFWRQREEKMSSKSGRCVLVVRSIDTEKKKPHAPSTR